MSNTMILAVNDAAIGIKSVVGHSTLPILRWIGSTAVRYSVAFVPAAAHGRLSDSVSIAMART